MATTQVKRGTVLKVPGDSAGLLFVDGKQVPFQLEGLWSSATAPAPNMTVDVTLDESGSVVGIQPVDPQKLAREQLGQITGAMGEQGKQAAGVAMNVFAMQASRMGYPTLVLMIVLWIAWFFLPALIAGAASGDLSRSISFSGLTGIDIGRGGVAGSFGFWSVIGLLCILAPWVAPWLKQRWAPLLNIAPFVFVILTFAHLSWAIHHAVSRAIDQVGAFGGSALAEQMAQAMSSRIESLISYGWGLWIVVIVSLVVAVLGVMRWLGQRRAVAAKAA